jgi:hypothetical protein
MNDNWMKVYDLSQDQATIALIQRASSQTRDFGFVPEIALFGSKEWWAAVEDGRVPRHSIQGVISRLYLSGHHDWPEFEIQSGDTTTRWTRFGDQKAYEVGRRVRLDYVLQRPKKPWRSQEVEQVLQIFVEPDRNCSPNLAGARSSATRPAGF